MLLNNILRCVRKSRSLCLNPSNVVFLSGKKFSSQNSNSDLVLTEKVSGITTIAINRQERRNCVDIATADALLKAFKDFEADKEAKVAVLYGIGGYFSAGLDLKEISQIGMKTINDAALQRGPMGPTRYETSKPVVGVVEGYAVAGGMELALWCDVRIMDEDAVFGIFCRRWGVPLIDGGAVRLPSIVGLGRALDIILTGRPIKSQEALNIGLATKVVDRGTALANAMVYAEALTSYPQEALKTDRNTARRTAFFSSNVSEALRNEMAAATNATREASAGATIFSGGKGRHGQFDIDVGLFSSRPDKKS